MLYDQHKKALIKLIDQAAYRFDRWRVFSDFVEMAAISLANSCASNEAREQRYMDIVSGYQPDEAALFPQMLGHVTAALDSRHGDVLGEVFMDMNLGNDDRGQFFTPYDVCLLIAQINNIAEQAKHKEFVTVNDPAIGAGALLIAFAQVARDQGVNFQTQIHASGTDVDIKAVHMAYIQLSVIGLPATITHGNSLTLEEHSHWYTPMYALGLWRWKLNRERRQLDYVPDTLINVEVQQIQGCLI